MYIVAKIHNSSLGKVVEAKNEADAKDILRGWAEEQFERPLTDEEIDDMEDYLEVVNEDDIDNIFTFSIGLVE
jgi:predicted house-cleaning noncanonical NTP pyrophosphatase (MazG superfamily)